jgi:hypothetical protein
MRHIFPVRTPLISAVDDVEGGPLAAVLSHALFFPQTDNTLPLRAAQRL